MLYDENIVLSIICHVIFLLRLRMVFHIYKLVFLNLFMLEVLA